LKVGLQFFAFYKVKKRGTPLTAIEAEQALLRIWKPTPKCELCFSPRGKWNCSFQ